MQATSQDHELVVSYPFALGFKRATYLLEEQYPQDHSAGSWSYRQNGDTALVFTWIKFD